MKRYMISDAANLVNVESHVLRYWEEELELDIPRNELGHRYYTEENIAQFQKIKKLKEEGYQLKSIKMLVQEKKLEQQEEGAKSEAICQFPVHKMANVPETVVKEKENNIERFQELMTQIVKNAIAENNQALGKEVGEQVGDRVLKEMNYLMREQDEQEEERYRKLDEAIRTRQRRHFRKTRDKQEGKKKRSNGFRKAPSCS